MAVARSYGYVKKWIVGKSALEPRENACTQGPGAHVSARVQGLDLVLGHPSVPGFRRGYLKKTRVHISAQQVPYSGTSARAPSVNAPFTCSCRATKNIKNKTATKQENQTRIVHRLALRF